MIGDGARERIASTRAPARALCEAVLTRAFHNGLLLLSCGVSTVRFIPPLMINRGHVDEAMGLIETALTEALASRVMSPATGDAPPPGRAPRVLGVLMCTALVVGNTIGIGIFMMPAALAPYGMNAIPAWLITAGGCTCVAWVFAGLARSFPDDDGPYAYASRAFGGGVSFVMLWCYWVSTWVTNAAIAIGVVGYLSIFFPVLNLNRWLAAVTALSLLWLFVLINLRGVRARRLGAAAQHRAEAAAAGRHRRARAVGAARAARRRRWCTCRRPRCRCRARDRRLDARAVCDAGRRMRGDARRPGEGSGPHHPARHLRSAQLIVALIYICISLVPMLLIPQTELAASNAPFADLFARFLGAGSGKLLAAFVIVSGLGALNGWTLVLGELTVSFARHGGFPAALGKVNSHGAPTRAFVLTGIAASVMLIMNYNDSMAGAFTFLSVVVTAANLPLYLGCALAVLVLWRRGEIPRPGPRETRWFAAALIATVYCVWVVDRHRHASSLLWALALERRRRAGVLVVRSCATRRRWPFEQRPASPRMPPLSPHAVRR